MLLTLGFVGVDEGIVLCFGGDGHVAIEAVGPKGCAQVDTAPDHTASAVAIPVASSHCGPCVDVALATAASTKSTDAAKRAQATTTAIATAEPRPPIPHLRVSVAYQRVTRFSSEKPYTVVIRC
jgi:hypothetical protein